MNMGIPAEFLGIFFDEVSFLEFEIKPIEAIMWIIFLIITLLTIINPNYLNNFIDFGVKMILSTIFSAYFMKMLNII